MTVDYTLTGNTGCTMDSAGAVTGTAVSGASCEVTATLSKQGYNDLTNTYSVTIVKGDQTLAWGLAAYAGTITFPSTISPGSAPANPASGGGSVEYQVKSGSTGNCNVDGNSGFVTPLAAGAGNNCIIQMRYAGNANYNPSPWVEDTITINKGTIRVAGGTPAAKWGTINTVTVGVDNTAATIGSITPSSGVTKAWTSLTTGTCTVGATSGSVRGVFVSSGTCQVKVTLSADGYNDLPHTYATVDVGIGSQAITWANPYGASLTYPDTMDPASPPPNPASNPSGGVLEYRVKLGSGSVCNVGAGNGRVRVLAGGAGGNCTIQARYKAVADKYNASPWVEDTISTAKGDFVVAGWGGNYGAVNSGRAAVAHRTSM